MGWECGSMGGGMMIVAGIFWLLVVVAIALGVVYLVRSLTRAGGLRFGGDEALRILEGRYARGEIDEQEFRARRELLRGER